MTMNSSGPISLAGSTSGQSIALELGQSATGQISLNDSAVRTLAGVASGAIVMPTNFYGKSNQFAFTISTNQTNANLRSLAVAAGWNQSSKVVATINAGVYVSSNSTGTPALTINGSFPGGVELVNNGYIIGMGGAGGGGYSIYTSTQYGSPGANGGLALSVSSAVSITNNGTIGGGGGGGGGGASLYQQVGCCGYLGGGGGGGGGRTGTYNSSGGVGGIGYGTYSYVGNPGNSGTSASAGSGGSGYNMSGRTGGTGGTGGSWGSSGSSGGNNSVNPVYNNVGPGGGGSGGGAVSGNSNVTWIATGTRLGSIS